MRSVVAIGATSALMVAGLAFVAVSPASAAAGTHLGFTVEPTSTTTAGTALASFQVTVEDASNNPATDSSATDTIAITSSCTLTGSTPAAASSAVVNFTGVAITVGTSCTLTASDTTHPGITSAPSTSITVIAAAANKVGYTTAPPVVATVNVALTTFKASVEDTYGNVVTSGAGSADTITISTATVGCAVGGTTTGPGTAGVSTFSALTITSGTGCVLTATATGLTVAASAPVTVATTTPTKLGFKVQPPTSAAAGSVLASFAVSVEESNGIPITSGTGSTDVVTLTSTCTLTGTLTATAVAGVATFTAVSIKTGTACTLVATDTSRTLTTGSSTTVNVVAGAATQVVFTTAPPTTETAASTILATFKATVEDVNGNVVTSGTGSTDTIAITSTCALGGTTTAAAVAGVATFSSLSINVTGSCVLTATDSTRTLTTATHTTAVGTPQATVTVKTLKGSVGTTLRLSIAGGTGTGAVTWTLAAGSSAGCSVSGNALKARRAGTCTVTATKAGDTTYQAASSAATKVTFVLPLKAIRVIGAVLVGRTSTVTITGTGFSGRPRIIANIAGVSARVTGDTGRALKVLVTVRSGVRTGVHSFTVILSTGKRTSVKFHLI